MAEEKEGGSSLAASLLEQKNSSNDLL